MTALITNSRAKLARLCARRHDLQYRQGYRPTGEAEELAFGSLIHEALAAWWRLATPGGDIDARLTAAQAVLDAATLDPFVAMKARVMVTGYHARWCSEPLHVVAVEVEFAGPLRNPDTGAASQVWRLGGKLDVVARDAAGDLWLVEHKTSNEDLTPGGTYHRRLRMDSQVSIYFDGAEVLGHKVHGCIYDVLAKPAQRPLKATPAESRKYKADGKLYANQRDVDEVPEAYCARLVEAVTAKPDEFFARIEVPRLEQELDDARRDLWQQAQRIREDERLGRAPRNPEACNAYGRVCPFFDVCTGAASLDDTRLFTQSENVHPELAAVVP